MLMVVQLKICARNLEHRFFDYFCRGGFAFDVFSAGIDTKCFLAAGEVLLILDQRVSYANRTQSGANLVFWNFLLESEGAGVAAEEIFSEHRFAAIKAETDADEDQGPGDGESGLGELHEIEFGRAHQMEHVDGFEPIAVEEEVENHARDDQGGEQAGGDTPGKGDAESSN